MRTLRVAIMGAAVLLVCGGYVASQWFYWSGRASAYARAIDVPMVQLLASILLLGSIVVWLVHDRSEGEAR